MIRHSLERAGLHRMVAPLRAPVSALPWASLKASLRASPLFFTVTLLSLAIGSCGGAGSTSLDLHWDKVADRPWPGPELWANRLQDWEVREGKLRAISSLPMRTAHLLTRRSVPEAGEILATLKMGLSGSGDRAVEPLEGEERSAAGGLLVGAGGADLDYRRAALIHHSPGPGGGLFLGVDEQGRLLVADFSDEKRILARSDAALPATDSLELRILVREESAAHQVVPEEAAIGDLYLQGAQEILPLEHVKANGHKIDGQSQQPGPQAKFGQYGSPINSLNGWPGKDEGDQAQTDRYFEQV